MRLLAMGVPVDHARCCDLHIAALKSVFPVKEPDLSPILGGEWEDGEKVASCMFALDTCVPALSSSSCVGHWIQAACEFAGVIIFHLLPIIMMLMLCCFACRCVLPLTLMLLHLVGPFSSSLCAMLRAATQIPMLTHGFNCAHITLRTSRALSLPLVIRFREWSWWRGADARAVWQPG